MQNELTIGSGEPTGLTADDTGTSARAARRTPRAYWRTLDYKTQDRVIGATFCGAMACFAAAVLFLALAYPAIARHNNRVQAVQRAMKMDGEVFIITNVGWNWIGDTQLYLQNARGEDAGWIMIHSENPIHKDINPFYLAFTPKRYDPLPLPMKVRAHFRQQPWTEKYLDRERTHENFTGSFIEFEKLDD
jgi:hypothetical protein